MIDPLDEAEIAEIATRYAPLILGADLTGSFPDEDTMWQIIQWQRLETEIDPRRPQCVAQQGQVRRRAGRPRMDPRKFPPVLPITGVRVMTGAHLPVQTDARQVESSPDEQVPELALQGAQ